MNMDHMNAALESIADLARTLKGERDIARLERDEAIVDYQRVYKERNEAREDAKALAERLTVLELTSTSELARLERERDEARKDAEYWKDSLKLLGETPEQVFESWRIRHTNVFKYIRLMVSWREKYNISKKEAEYYRERYEQLKDERETARAYRDLTRAMQKDADYAHTWQCNIACPLMDEGMSHEDANKAADRLMKHLFNVKTNAQIQQ